MRRTALDVESIFDSEGIVFSRNLIDKEKTMQISGVDTFQADRGLKVLTTKLNSLVQRAKRNPIRLVHVQQGKKDGGTMIPNSSMHQDHMEDLLMAHSWALSQRF